MTRFSMAIHINTLKQTDKLSTSLHKYLKATFIEFHFFFKIKPTI